MKFSLRHFVAALLGLWVLIWIAYWISLPAVWHIDDIPNIVRNQKIHLSRLAFSSIVDTFFAGPTGKFYRPIPMASFALNWYFHGSEVFGYRLVNILIHCTNAVLLYLIVHLLLQTPRLSGAYNRVQIHWIAFINAVFWSLNPLQVQAVTYIVQRMASMAALFFLLGIYFFLHYRIFSSGAAKKRLLFGCVLSYLLAILSKENAVLFPLSIYVINQVFCTEDSKQICNSKWLVLGTVSLLLTLAIGSVIFLVARGNLFDFIEELYVHRSFTMTERVLTEFRILLLYLSKLFFPLPSRLSFCHDIKVSTSILNPWTTLPSILLIVGALVLSIIGYRKKPLLSFALLFFFLNHGIESTILPLELVFEHRNYLPSVFLFLPLSIGVVRIYEAAYVASRVRRILVIGSVCLAIGLLGNWTFGRNMLWLSAKTLWEDEIQKYPRLARPYHNLAWGYYQAHGKYRQAMALYRKALKLKPHTPLETASTLNNMGRISYLLGDYNHSRHYFERAIQTYPALKLAKVQLASTLIQMNLWEEALAIIDSALQKNPLAPFLLKLKGIALMHKGDINGAAISLSQSLNLRPDAADTRAHLSIVLGRMARYDEALGILNGNKIMNKKNLQYFMVASEIEKMRGDLDACNKLFDQTIQRYGPKKVKEQIFSWKDDKLAIVIGYSYYLSHIAE